MKQLDQQRIVLDEALTALMRETNLHGRVLRMQPRTPDRKYGSNALVEIKEEGKPFRFVAEIKGTMDRAIAVTHVKAQLDQQRPNFPDYEPLLVTRFVTRRMADECRKFDLPFIDTAGNAYLRAPGMLVLVAGQERSKDPEKVAYRANTQVGLKIVFALLCNPLRIPTTYRDIANHAAVALGAVGPVLKDLEQRGYLRRTKARGLVLANKRKLLDEWTARYPEVLRPKLEARRYQVDTERLLHADLTSQHAYWGSEKAADLLTGYLRPELFTLYTRGPAHGILTQLRARLAPNGNTEVLQAFWAPELDRASNHIVPAILVYADLIATGISRNVETAMILYDRIIEPTFAMK